MSSKQRGVVLWKGGGGGRGGGSIMHQPNAFVSLWIRTKNDAGCSRLKRVSISQPIKSDLGTGLLSMSLKRSDLRRSATPTTTPAISAPRMALDNPLNDGRAGSTHSACSQKKSTRRGTRHDTTRGFRGVREPVKGVDFEGSEQSSRRSYNEYYALMSSSKLLPYAVILQVANA